MTDVQETTATFTVAMDPQPGLVAETSRFGLTKEWTGGIRGTSTGVMLSAGDPRAGAAGYVALEVVSGSVDGRAGTFALAQFGSMSGDDQSLRYEVVPGSGTGALEGLRGTVELTVDDGHAVTFRYSLPA